MILAECTLLHRRIELELRLNLGFTYFNSSLYFIAFRPLIAYHYTAGCSDSIPSHSSVLARSRQDILIR